MRSGSEMESMTTTNTIVATTASQDTAPVTPERAPRTTPAMFDGLSAPWSWSRTWVSVTPHCSSWSTAEA